MQCYPGPLLISNQAGLLSAECVEGIVLKLPTVHLHKAARISRIWAQALSTGWKTLFCTRLWGLQPSMRALLPTAHKAWRMTYSQTLRMIRRQFIVGNMDQFVQMTPMGQEITSHTYGLRFGATAAAAPSTAASFNLLLPMLPALLIVVLSVVLPHVLPSSRLSASTLLFCPCSGKK